MLHALASSYTLLTPLTSSFEERLNQFLGKSFIKGVPVEESGHVMLSVLVLIIIGILAYRAHWKFKVRYDRNLTVRTFFELIFDALLGMMERQMGRKNAEKFLPLIGTLAIYILVSNALALIPGLAPPTDNLNTTVAPALVVFFVTHWVGIREHGWKYIYQFIGPFRSIYAFPLMIGFAIIEMIGHLARPMSLSLRLFGNMFADHLVLGIFVGLVPFVVPVPILALGFIVVIVQTMVFSLLAVIYISMALSHDH